MQRWIPATRLAGRDALLIAGAFLATGLLWVLVAAPLAGTFLGAGPDPVPAWLLAVGPLVVAAGALFLSIRDRLLSASRSGQLEDLASYDALTGLPSTAMVCSQLNRALFAADDRRPVLGVVAVHVAGLREVNESGGARAGDQLLAAVAQRLRAALPPGALLARHEGCAFVAVVEAGPDAEDGIDAAGRALLQAVGETLIHGSAEVRLRGSIGISRYPGDARSARELVASALDAMERARQGEGWHIPHFTARLTRTAYERFRLEKDLRRAVEQGDFELLYQPQVQLGDGSPVGLEALLRWSPPDAGPVAPGRFLPIAEECGLIQPIGEWVLRQACRQAALWRSEAVADLRIAVNLSHRQFTHPRLAGYLAHVLGETGLPPDRLELEIPEAALARQPDLSLRILKDLKDLGVSLAIDDFGSGFSSLSYLQVYPVDRLKIDRSFIGALDRDLRLEAACRAALDIGRNLLITRLAAGIETDGQCRMLRALGCDEGQGFLFGRPLPAPDVPAWLGVEPVRGERKPLAALAL